MENSKENTTVITIYLELTELRTDKTLPTDMNDRKTHMIWMDKRI